jgi:hypothetical protein
MVAVTDIPVVDADSHVIEPPDLWSLLLPKHRRGNAPHLEWDDTIGQLLWHVGQHALSPALQFDHGGLDSDACEGR